MVGQRLVQRDETKAQSVAGGGLCHARQVVGQDGRDPGIAAHGLTFAQQDVRHTRADHLDVAGLHGFRQEAALALRRNRVAARQFHALPVARAIAVKGRGFEPGAVFGREEGGLGGGQDADRAAAGMGPVGQRQPRPGARIGAKGKPVAIGQQPPDTRRQMRRATAEDGVRRDPAAKGQVAVDTGLDRANLKPVARGKEVACAPDQRRAVAADAHGGAGQGDPGRRGDGETAAKARHFQRRPRRLPQKRRPLPQREPVRRPAARQATSKVARPAEVLHGYRGTGTVEEKRAGHGSTSSRAPPRSGSAAQSACNSSRATARRRTLSPARRAKGSAAPGRKARRPDWPTCHQPVGVSAGKRITCRTATTMPPAGTFGVSPALRGMSQRPGRMPI